MLSVHFLWKIHSIMTGIVILSAHFLRKTHSIMTGIVILSASEGSRKHPRGCEILPPYGRQNDKRGK